MSKTKEKTTQDKVAQAVKQIANVVIVKVAIDFLQSKGYQVKGSK